MAAVKADQVAVRPGEFSRTCPWIPTFVARVDAVIGTEEFRTGQLFTFKAGVDGEYFGRGFERLGFLPGTQPPRPKPRPEVRERVQPRAERATRSQAQQDQRSGPQPIDTQHHGKAPRAAPSTAGSVRAGIPDETDIWALTAAFQRPQRRSNRSDTEQLRALWRADPDPASTLACHEELMAAVRAGKARQHGDEALRDCPWSQVYVAVSQVTIGGVRLERNEKFALEVGVTGGQFRRRISRLGLIAAGA